MGNDEMIGNVLAFTAAAAVLTVTPGLDTALILRTSVSEGGRRAFMAGAGIAVGCLAWGLLVAFGLGALLAASALAYDVLRWAGAAYLVWLGVRLIRSPRRGFQAGEDGRPSTGTRHWFARGLLTNLLNPKVGVFYVSFLPQFIPAGVNVPAMAIFLTAIHAALGLTWFSALILATKPLARVLGRPNIVAWLDRVTGGIFIAFGARLALSSR